MGLLNPANTNLENGITNRKDSDIFGSMGMPDPTKFTTHWDDFHTLPTFVASTGNYTAPATGTIVAGSNPSGLVLFTGSNAGDNTIVQTQIKHFHFDLILRLYFRLEVNLDDVNNTFFIAGLADNHTDNPANGVFFLKNDTTNTLDFVVHKTGVTTTVNNIATVSDNETFTVEFYWDGVDKAYYGVNRNILGSLDITEDMISVVALAPTFGIASGASGGSKFAVFDYVFANQERD